MELFNFLIGILQGSVTCFFGLKMRKIVLVLSWFIVGYFGLSFFIEHTAMNDTLKFVLQIALGIVFAILSLKLQKIAWFLMVFVIGFFMVFISMPEAWYSLILALVVGLVFGVIAIYLYEPMIVISTALGGAYSIALSIANYFNLNKVLYLVLIFAVLAVAGLSVQLVGLKKAKAAKKLANKNC